MSPPGTRGARIREAQRSRMGRSRGVKSGGEEGRGVREGVSEGQVQEGASPALRRESTGRRCRWTGRGGGSVVEVQQAEG